MLPSLKAEFYKLTHSKKLLITSAIIIILFGGISYLNGYFPNDQTFSIKILENILAFNSIFYYFSLTIIIVFVSYEYRFQTIKNYIISGESRYKFIVNKLIFLSLITFTYLFLANLIAGILILIGMSFSNSNFILFENFDVYLLRFLISIIIAFQFIILFTSAQVIFKSSGMTIGIAIGFPIIFNLIIQIIALVSRNNQEILKFLSFLRNTDINALSSLLATEYTIDILKPLAWSLVLFTILPLTLAFIKIKKSEL